jgi:hypothetical protein
MTPEQPPSTEQAQPPRVLGGPKVYGILSIIFASLTLLFSLSTGCMAMAGRKGDLNSWMLKGQPNQEARAAAYQRFYDRTYPATVAQTMIYALMSIGLLVVGIGQLRYKRWARPLSLTWGLVALLCVVATVMISLLVVKPANRELFAEMQRLSAGTLDAAVNRMAGSMADNPWTLAGSVVLYAPYPVLLLIYFSRSAVRAAMDR